VNGARVSTAGAAQAEALMKDTDLDKMADDVVQAIKEWLLNLPSGVAELDESRHAPQWYRRDVRLTPRRPTRRV